MTAPGPLAGVDAWTDEVTPLLRRAVALDPKALVRVRVAAGRVSVLVRLPFSVTAGRSLATEPTDARAATAAVDGADATWSAAELLARGDGPEASVPERRDAEWRWPVPPTAGWHRIETVPDDVVRPLVRQGALTLKAAAEREGVPGAQPRAEVAEALLDAVVLSVTDGSRSAEVTLRTLSMTTRLGFLPRGGSVAVDVCGRWTRVAAPFGSVFAERPALGLAVR